MLGKTSLIEIDPDGDVTLEFSRSDGITQLLVSSKILSLSSTVFKRMFRSQFRESLSNKNPATNNNVVIPLLDENVEAFTLLCNVLHCRINSGFRTPTIACLIELSMICDKWDFTDAVAFSAEVWLQDIDPSTNNKDLNKFLRVAYILNAPFAFSRISWEILLRQVGPVLDLPGLTGHDLIPNSLLVEFKARKLELDMALVKAIDDVISGILKCKQFSFYAAIFFSHVRTMQLWSIAEQLTNRNISSIVEHIAKTFPSNAFVSCNTPGCLCTPTKFRDALSNAKDIVMREKRGLCLDCVKRNTKSGQVAGCRFCISPKK